MVVKSGLLISFKGSWATEYQLPSARVYLQIIQAGEGQMGKEQGEKHQARVASGSASEAW